MLNKYIPADFDPSLVPKGKKLSSKDGTVPVRMMLPFSAQCSTCQTFLYRGRKFNSKKEPMGGPNGTYLGITRWRFYIKCTHCSRPVTFLTDPKNADYEMESGATRNYEIQKDKAATEEEADAEKVEEEKLDPMKALENRVLESQQEVAAMDQLEEIKAMNARHVKLLAGKSRDAIVQNIDHEDSNAKEIELSVEDEALVKSIQFGFQRHDASAIKRLDESDEQHLQEQRQRQVAELAQRQREMDSVATTNNHKKQSTLPVVIKRKRKIINNEDTDNSTKKSIQTSAQPVASILASLLGGYGSDSSKEGEE